MVFKVLEKPRNPRWRIKIAVIQTSWRNYYVMPFNHLTMRTSKETFSDVLYLLSKSRCYGDSRPPPPPPHHPFIEDQNKPDLNRVKYGALMRTFWMNQTLWKLNKYCYRINAWKILEEAKFSLQRRGCKTFWRCFHKIHFGAIQACRKSYNSSRIYFVFAKFG